MRLGTDEIKLMGMFETLTGATVRDCVIEPDELLFLVKEGDMGIAIGKKGIVINRVREQMGKNVTVIEHSDKPERFVANLLHPAIVENVTISEGADGKVAKVSLKFDENGRTLSRNGKKMRRARELLERHYGIKDIRLK